MAALDIPVEKCLFSSLRLMWPGVVWNYHLLHWKCIIQDRKPKLTFSPSIRHPPHPVWHRRPTLAATKSESFSIEYEKLSFCPNCETTIADHINSLRQTTEHHRSRSGNRRQNKQYLFINLHSSLTITYIP